jgi:hypothetical protein
MFEFGVKPGIVEYDDAAGLDELLRAGEACGARHDGATIGVVAFAQGPTINDDDIKRPVERTAIGGVGQRRLAACGLVSDVNVAEVPFRQSSDDRLHPLFIVLNAPDTGGAGSNEQGRAAASVLKYLMVGPYP